MRRVHPSAMSSLVTLHLAAKHHLRQKKKSLALKLAAEILAVDCGLKPCLLYDLSAAGVLEVQGYLQELHQVGFIQGPLHVLNLAETILIINVSRAVSCLMRLLHGEELHVVDVSVHLKQPEMLSRDRLGQIRAQLSDLLTHLRPYQGEEPGAVSVGDLPCPEWNLCTMFGLLLHYPAVYWFNTTKNFENCLAFTPLKRFVVQTACPELGLRNMPVYSFTVPESVFPWVQAVLRAWSEELALAFRAQSHFTELETITETVTLPAVAL